jgi:hypothetical protein
MSESNTMWKEAVIVRFKVISRRLEVLRKITVSLRWKEHTDTCTFYRNMADMYNLLLVLEKKDCVSYRLT